jgi:putative phosphoribosyl transferase
MAFANRTEAGRRLAEKLMSYKGEDVVVLALPRGGVVVAVEVAQALEAPMDLAIAKKIGHPANPEAAIGAVTEDGVRIMDGRADGLIDPAWLEAEASRKAEEAVDLRAEYMGDKPHEPLSGRTAILVDDGIATGYTMMAAVESAKKRGAAKVVVAVPVAPPETVWKFKSLADDVVVVEAPPLLYAVGAHYEDFRQVSDQTVKELMGKSGSDSS